MSENDKVHLLDSTQLHEGATNREDIWTSGFDSTIGMASPPPPLQLTANPANPPDLPADSGGLSPDQWALVESFGMKAMVSGLPESDQAALASFLTEFQTKATVIKIGETMVNRTLSSEGRTLSLSVETLPGGGLRKAVEYSYNGNEFRNIVVEGVESPILDQGEPTVDVPDGGGVMMDVPSKGALTLMEDILSTPTKSARLGVEGDVPVLDPHLYYSRKIAVRAVDGRRITLAVYGRTNLTGSFKGATSLDIKGDSFLSMQISVRDDQGELKYEEHVGTGTSINEAIPVCAASGGFAEVLLQRRAPNETLLDAVLAKANTMIAPIPEPESGEVEVIGEGGGINQTPSPRTQPQDGVPTKVGGSVHVSPHMGSNQRKPWGELSQEERRHEAWDTFSAEFSWNRVGTGIIIGLGIMGAVFGLLSIPVIAPFVLPLLGLLGVVMGLGTILAPLLSGRNPTEMEWLKGGLMVIGGVALLVATVLALPELAGAAIFTAIASGVLLLASEIVDSILTFKEATKANSRDEMHNLAKESARKGEQGIVDAILSILPVRTIQKHVRGFLRKGTRPGAPGEEGIPPRDAEEPPPLARDEENTNTRRPEEIDETAPHVNPGTMDAIYQRQKEIVEAVRRGEIRLTTNQQKGNFGEMVTDVEMIEAGWTPHHQRVTSLDQTVEQGIDHVFTNPGPPPMTVVADSKYGSARLKKLVSGQRQMSSQWIENRLDDAVGPEMAQDIRDSGYSSVVAKIKSDGRVTYSLLDTEGRKIATFTP